MNYIQKLLTMDVAAESREEPRGRRSGGPATEPAHPGSKVKGFGGSRNLALGALVLLCGALGIGFWQHYELHAQVMSAIEQRRDFVPSVRTAPVRASSGTMAVSWPGTTEAFEQANIYARASGYISHRDVDIGSRVKAGQLLVEITAPELDHQIAQAEGTLAQMQATLQQAKANRDLALVTWDRDNPLVQKGWVTPQQGDTDRLTLQARDAAVAGGIVHGGHISSNWFGPNGDEGGDSRAGGRRRTGCPPRGPGDRTPPGMGPHDPAHARTLARSRLLPRSQGPGALQR